MKRAINWGVGVLALAGMTLPSAAADLGARPVMKAPVAIPPPFSWTSCYIGVDGGGKWANWTGDGVIATGVAGFPFAATVVSNNNGGGGMFGGQLGCQWQSGAFVFGLEGDIDGVNLKRSFVAGPGAFAPFLPGDTLVFKNDWQASIRGRLGYAWDRWLIYATGGVAFANVKAALGLVPFTAGSFASVSNTATGGTVGAGIEYAFLDYLSLGIEYRYSSFGHQSLALGTVGGILPVAAIANPGVNTNEVTARLNWHFNWWH
jgi:outer membrane immunogenic protein